MDTGGNCAGRIYYDIYSMLLSWESVGLLVSIEHATKN